MINQTEKAKTVTITLGDQEVECLVMPNGDYKIGFYQVAALFSFPTKHAARDIKALLPNDSSFPKLAVEGSRFKRAIPVMNLMQFGIAICMMSAKGNKFATAHLVACQVEAMERRIDTEVGIIRKEKERNDRFIARRDSILQRHFWTDCIKWWLDNNDVSDNTRKFIYSNVSNKLNRALFGMAAKEIRVAVDAEPSELIRDIIDPAYLLDIQFLEMYAGTQVKKGLTPMQAIEEALVFMQIKPGNPAKK